MKNIYFVESPLQMLSAISACREVDGEHHLFVNFGDKNRIKNYSQLTRIVDESKSLWNTVDELKLNNFNNRYISLFNSILLTYKLTSRFGKNQCRVFSGEYRNRSFSLWSLILAKPDHEYLLDDGAVIINLQLEFFSKGLGFISYMYKGKNRSIIKLFRALFKFDLHNNPPNLYSIFKADKFLHKNQVNLKSSEELKPKKNFNAVFFFGSKYSEAGLLTLNAELKYLKGVYSDLKRQFDYCIYYIPHRDDNQAKIRSLTTIGFVIKDLNAPCEQYFNLAECIPSVISGFYTTSIYSLSQEYIFEKVISFDISESFKSSQHFNVIRNVYDFYKNTAGIDVVNMNNY